jgi:hypothetical protein
MSQERERLKIEGDAWRHWGPYLSERAWGTVREDYSDYGTAWDYFPHDHARSRAYRWNEDGLAGISDDKGRMCFALALWNGQDPILKERLFGLTGPQGNHGEDVKEYYFYLDSTPTHSYMKMLYKYPQAAFPYGWLVEETARRGRGQSEFELVDTGIFAENRYFDVFVEYAKAAPEDILIKISATNRGPDPAPLTLLPTLWFRNSWSWEEKSARPYLQKITLNSEGQPSSQRDTGTTPAILADHPALGRYLLFCDNTPCDGPGDGPGDGLVFTENETNFQRVYGSPNPRPYVKDAFHEYIVNGQPDAVNPAQTGTKAAAVYRKTLAPGETVTVRLRLTMIQAALTTPNGPARPPKRTEAHQKAAYAPAYRLPPPEYYAYFVPQTTDPFFKDFDRVLGLRRDEADEFYHELFPPSLDESLKQVERQALAGMLWSKQFYYFIVSRWLSGDPTQPPPPAQRAHGRNSEWRHLHNERVMSMPDKWEYPWYAAWDLAFHCIPLALVDIDFAKSQLDLLLREWYQHPNGQIPAYEWAFGDVNPPVFAWAAWRLYKTEQKQTGETDRLFLESIFHKLLINFTWWVNRKDSEGNNVFEGGFLGLDNIGVFDRSAPLPTGGFIEQSDGTSWMGMFSLNMMKIALELALINPVYEDIATKFFEHFLFIAAAMDNIADEGIKLWDSEDEFFYDVLKLPDGRHQPMKVRSLVGLIPLLATATIEPELLEALPAFKERLEWFLTYRPELTRLVSQWEVKDGSRRRLLGLVRGHRMKRLLSRMLDPDEFLSEYGIRSLSKFHEQNPYQLEVDGQVYMVRYEPAESRTGLFGGNSNWRGPVWFPINYLLVEALQRYHHYYGDDFKVECPTNSGRFLTLGEIADELSTRLIRLFTPDEQGRRPYHGGQDYFNRDPHWRDYLLFYEYFQGDDGAGLGASHQTGWTGLVAKLIQRQGENAHQEDPTADFLGAGD